ncbi:glycosyltransferase [Natrinema sp. CGMCC1.2065]|uniref:glycosyltransferase n=1 Tax=Natrinema sp. CGMCC1.2065 TaxID=3445767 RepID=UPI003F4A42D0
MHITAVIPAYNERDNIEELTRRLDPVLAEHVDEYSLHYVYQGTDGGAERIKELSDEYPNISVDHYPDPLGVGKAYQVGLHSISDETTHVLTMDADLNHRPEELDRLFNARGDGDVVIGSRFVEGGNFDDLHSWRKLASPFAAKVVSGLFGVDANDVSSGYRLYDAEVIREIRDNLTFQNFEFYPEALVRATRAGFSVTEVPITYDPRKHGESKMDEFGTALGYVKLLYALNFSRE